MSLCSFRAARGRLRPQYDRFCLRTTAKEGERAPIVAPPAAALPVDEVVHAGAAAATTCAHQSPKPKCNEAQQPLPLPPTPAENDSAGNRPSASANDAVRSRREKVANGAKDRPDPAARRLPKAPARRARAARRNLRSHPEGGPVEGGCVATDAAAREESRRH